MYLFLFIYFLSLLSPEVVIKVILFHAVRWKIENSGQKQTSMSVDNLSWKHIRLPLLRSLSCLSPQRYINPHPTHSTQHDNRAPPQALMCISWNNFSPSLLILLASPTCTMAPFYACKWELLCNKRVSAEPFHKGPQWVDNKPRGEHELLWRLKWGDPTPSLSRSLSVPLCSTFSPPPCLSLLSQAQPFIHFLGVCVISTFSASFHIFLSVLFLRFCFFFSPPGWCSAAFLSPNVLYLCILYLFMWSAKSTPPISPSFCLSFYSIPSLSLQLWQRMISSPILWPGCPGQELQCRASRGGGWGLGGDLREMDLIWITRAETPAVRVGSVCVWMCTRAGEMVMGGGKNAGLEQCELFWIRTSALQF